MEVIVQAKQTTAVQFLGEPLPGVFHRGGYNHYVNTPDGTVPVREGDWLIGGSLVLSSEEFEHMYDRV